MSKKLGYGVASTLSSRDSQINQLKEYVSESDIYIDMKDTNYAEWEKLKGSITGGDTLIIVSLDRLGRDFEHVYDVLKELEEKEIQIQSLKKNNNEDFFKTLFENKDLRELTMGMGSKVEEWMKEADTKYYNKYKDILPY